MNNQETFDFVVNALRAQKRRSSDKDGACMYRSPDGLKCAVGHLIPDDKYNKRLEWHNADESLIYNLIKDYDIKLLIRLQQVHDYLIDLEGLEDNRVLISPPNLNLDNCVNWEDGWRKAADEFGLVYTEPTND